MTPPADASVPSLSLPTRRALRIALQLLAFAACLALLAWYLSVALSPKNRQQFDHLRHAPPADLALLLLLSAATILINGTAFWVALRPVRRLRFADAVATNAVATALGFLPFKLSLLARVAVHHKRDGVPVLLIGAWLAAVAAVITATIAPVVAASLWRGRVDAIWAAAALGGVALCCTLMVLAARSAARGLLRALGLGSIRLARRVPLLARLLNPRLGARVHEGALMLADGRAVAAGAALRLTDLAVQAARFVVASSILAGAGSGESLPWDHALLASSVYFLIGVASPAGTLGVREAGAAGALSFLHSDGLMVVPLLVTAADMAVALIGALGGAWWLKRNRREAPDAHGRAAIRPGPG